MKLRELAAWFLGTRLVLYFAMVLGTFWPRPGGSYLFWAGQTADGLWYQHVPTRWLDVFGRWDSMFYVNIATNGYPAPPTDGGYNFYAAFFPLFPALLRGLSELLPLTPFLAGILLSNLLFFAALVYVGRLVSLDGTPAQARTAIITLLVFPLSHFFSVVYTESTALLLMVLGLYAVRTSRPGLASLACALALWARPTGWVTCVAVALELARDASGRLRPNWRLAWLLVPASALAAVLALNQMTALDPLAFLHVQEGWGRARSFPFSSLLDTRRTLDHHVLALAGVGLLVLAYVQRQRASLLVFATLNLLVPLSTGSIQSMPRFVVSNLPLPLAFSRALDSRPRTRGVVYAACLAASAMYAMRWGMGHQPN